MVQSVVINFSSNVYSKSLLKGSPLLCTSLIIKDHLCCVPHLLLLAVTGVVHEADDAYSIWSTWSCYWLDQFLTLALDAWILSKFSTLYWICLLLVFLILVSVELPLCL